jgi:hypothetical protein
MRSHSIKNAIHLCVSITRHKGTSSTFITPPPPVGIHRPVKLPRLHRLLVIDASDSARMRRPSGSAAAAAARETADDDAEERDDSVDDGLETGCDGVDNGHDAVTDGAEDGLDLLFLLATLLWESGSKG